MRLVRWYMRENELLFFQYFNAEAIDLNFVMRISGLAFEKTD
jgi:hypothetical protein